MLVARRPPPTLPARRPRPPVRAAPRPVAHPPRRPPPPAASGALDGQATASDAPSSTPAPLPPFSWTRVWWPVAVAADTPTDRPVPVKLLGARLVLWRDASSTWRCVASACPHRGAPLETGRIDEGGHLACSYHGWAFDGADGRAVSIPQASHDSPGCGERACASRRSRAAARPTRVAAGLIWVWGDPDPAGADAAPPPVVSDVLGGRDPDTGDGGWPLTTNQQFARDFPVPYDVMVENVLDQSHVPFAHTGVASARASPWAAHFTVSDVKVAVDGGPSSSSPSSPSPPAAARADTGAAARGDGLNFTLEWSPDARSPPVAQRVRFVPPCYVEYVTPAPPDSVGDGGHPFKTALWFYVTPLDSHTTRVFNHAVVGRAPQLPRWAAAALAARPRWVDHLLLNEVFDGDLAYLPQAAANARAAELAGRPWSKYYYLPASADNAVVAWRRWFTGRGKGGWEGDAGLPPRGVVDDVPPAAAWDRAASHTAHCASCSAALARLRAAASVLRAAAVAAVAAGAGGAAGGAGAGAVVGALALGAGAAAAGAACEAGAARFVWKEYEHWKSK